MSPEPAQLGLPLASQGTPWPPGSRFPHNFGGETVGAHVYRDLLDSERALLITGYAGIEHLLGFFHRWSERERPVPQRPVRLLIGVEPTLRPVRDPNTAVGLEAEARDYWLFRGISLLNSQQLLSTLELLEKGRLEVRLSDAIRVHAKMYVGDNAVTLGSSNFTRPGLDTNLEANARFERAGEGERYSEAVALAENLWNEGRDFTEGLRNLLGQLLRQVSWQEALARACAELLDGDWAPKKLLEAPDRRPLWPSQEQGIAQALWVLENHGAVLVADATGSGKTRMGAHLLRVLQDRHWRMGRGRQRLPVLICPPAVRQLWAGELEYAAEDAKIVSHGALSWTSSERFRAVETALRNTQLLGVDEAHNFLNRTSQRSRMLYGNVADNVVLFTATPINRGARDLVAVVELLGADNFDDDVLKVVARLEKHARRRAQAKPLLPRESDTIREALQEFVVRRTKADFNRLIDREPESYVNALGKRCRYPEHEPVVFPREDPAHDRNLARSIRERAKQLRGMINFQGRLRMPGFLRFEGWNEERFLTMRIHGASALAAYQVRSRLRSSKVALVEHIVGTEEAGKHFGIGGLKTSRSGNVLGTLQRIAGKPPRISLSVEVPDWLADPGAHRLAVEEEIQTYRDILERVELMSDHRAEANADYLLQLLSDHERVLAFDSHLISLYDLRRRLQERTRARVTLATGERGARSRRDFARDFALGAEGKPVIGLCSDALAEGLNLQGASALVHLDLPSVIRLLEQRIGRLDRMDSPHERVEVHWPQEPPEFQLRADERLFWRLREVDDLLGSNVPIPEGFETYDADRGAYVDVQEIICKVEQETAPDAAMTLADAFSRVRAMVSGPEALVPEDLYESVRKSKVKVLSSVAVVPANDRPWVFLAVGSAERDVPRWVLVEQGAEVEVMGTLDRVASSVRARVSESPADMPFDGVAAGVLETALRAAEAQQEALLPRRKRRTLEELRYVLRGYERRASDDAERRQVVSYILGLLARSEREFDVDIGQLADWWLELIRPEWQEHLGRRGIKRPARLGHLRPRLIREAPVSTERLATIREQRLGIEPLDQRVVAAIVGVPQARSR